ncbi:leishmanolysin-related zinc metalloendopeptidase [Roseivirga misakiensis]|uniref:Peptidase n=1 Tax=Roseivirga misakiensis TaxID=1563681 RepID=A0A1E5SZ53_9BACT|nr:leishmanolysin-related zinc metalloendopeptidase [Roseivirga misakiensis]OEK04409.1 hypothetical protein BFP71_13090 [Roseivirga misakiensis]
MSSLTLNIRFNGGITPSQELIFQESAQRWSQIITEDLPLVKIDNEQIKGIVIDASAHPIDGKSGILGQAGPTRFRPDSGLPAKGIMRFDSADLDQLEDNNQLSNTIMHEIAHVIGFGTLWQKKGLIRGIGSANPSFTGVKACAEMATLLGFQASVTVPVANTGGRGTRDGHWREHLLGHELMTGFLNEGNNPISRLTIASFDDLGYKVDYSQADDYNLPSHQELAMMGIFADNGSKSHCAMCGIHSKKYERDELNYA